MLGAAFWDVCIQKVWHTRSFQLFVQVIDRHLCTELMCSVCNSIRSLLKVININDNTLGSSILTHIHIHSTHYLSDFCTNMNQSLSYINIFFSFLLKNPQKRKIKYAQGWKENSLRNFIKLKAALSALFPIISSPKILSKVSTTYESELF